MNMERHADGKFADYLLGAPVAVVWEAKRQGDYFDLPADQSRRTIQLLRSIRLTSESASKAIVQVHGYCVTRGAEFGVVCNGSQLIAFLAIRIGHPPLEGKALIFRDLDQMCAEFHTMWQHLSPDGIAERRLHRLLTTGSDASLPAKPSSYLMQFPVFRYKSEIQANLRDIAELLIEDIPASENVEEQFYRECYCDTGALSRDSLLSRQILAARYAALFPTHEPHPRMESASSQEKPLEITSSIMTEALAHRPIVLLGDVGVGKTAFLKQLMLLRASEEFKKSLNIYIDLA
jgi:hypothetical protein